MVWGVVCEKVGRIAGCLSSTVAKDSNLAPAAGTGAWIISRGGVHPGQDKFAPGRALLSLELRWVYTGLPTLV